MKNVMKNNYFKWGLTIFSVVAACIVFFFLVYKIGVIYDILATIMKILTPFIIGFVFAYLLNPIVKAFDEELFTRLLKRTKLSDEKKAKISNNLAIAHTFVLVIAILILLISFIIPQFLQSIESLITNAPAYLEQIKNYLLETIKNKPDLEKMISDNYTAINEYFNNTINNTFLPILHEWIANFSNGVWGILKGLYNIVIGFVIAIYFLADKNVFIAQIKKSLYSLLNIESANNLVDNARYMDKVFGNYIIGKLLDATVVGTLTFIFLAVFDFPYALLIGVIIGIANLIPYFGPFIGAVPSALLILLQSPSQAFVFLIYIFVLQQVDGNYIDPKLVGGKVGIKSFWVLFAILFFGGIWGIAGMIVGVPIFVVLSTYLAKKTNDRLIKRNLPIETEKYTNLNRINTENKKIVENKTNKKDDN